MGLKDAEYTKIIMHDSNCRTWHLKQQDAMHKEWFAHLYLEKAVLRMIETRQKMIIPRLTMKPLLC